jgi:hypothetical protein
MERTPASAVGEGGGRDMQIDRRPPLTVKDVEARRVVVRQHMCDLMKSIACDAKFNDPDEWIDTILNRRHPIYRKRRHANIRTRP